MKKLGVALAATIVISSVFLVLLPHTPSAIAQYSWTDTINIYKDINAVYTDIRKITNNETVTVDVLVYITFTERINLLEYYKLSANGTDFIIISQGAVTLSNGTYYGLRQEQTLCFTVEAKGASSLSIDDTVKVGVKVEFWTATPSLTITIISPQNKTYYSNSIPVAFETSAPTSWIGYSLDNQPNVTITGNTIINVEDGSHNIIVYANDTFGNMGSSQIVYFTVDSTYYAPWKTSFIGLGGYPIVDFAVYNGNLYAATDNVLVMYDGTSWNITDAPTYIISIEPYGDRLILAGQGGLYSFDGTTFNLIFSVPNYVKVLGVYNGTLYAGTMLDKPPTLHYCNGSVEDPSNWHIDTDFSTMLNFSGPFGSIDSFAVYNNNMHVTSGGTVYRYNGTDWSIVRTHDDINAFLDMKAYNGKLYLATRDQAWRKPYYQGYSGFSGRVIEFDGNNWTIVFDYDYWIYSLGPYDGELYIGTANKIYTYNGTDWSLSFNAVEDAYYAISFITFNDKIYVGMGNGYIFADPSSEGATPEVPVIQEFPSTIILLLALMFTTFAVIVGKKRLQEDSRAN